MSNDPTQTDTQANSVYDAFRASAIRYAGHDFLHIPRSATSAYRSDALDISYGEAASQVEQQKLLYQNAGYGCGHRVALMLQNRLEFFIHWLALNALGCCVVPINAKWLPKNRPISLITAKPKGCILSNEYYLLSGQRYVDLGGLCAMQGGTERLITPLPLVHMNAMACSSVAMILIGGCIVQLDRFHPRSWWQSVRESRATVAHYLGVMPAMLLNADPGDDDFSTQIKFAFGAGVNPKHHAAFEQHFGFPLMVLRRFV